MSFIANISILLFLVTVTFGANILAPKLTNLKEKTVAPLGILPIFELCGGSGLTRELEVEGCNAAECFFDHTQTYDMKITFSAAFSTNALRYRIHFKNTMTDIESTLYDLQAPGEVIGGSAYSISFPVDLDTIQNQPGIITLDIYDDIYAHVAACGKFRAAVN